MRPRAARRVGHRFRENLVDDEIGNTQVELRQMVDSLPRFGNRQIFRHQYEYEPGHHGIEEQAADFGGTLAPAVKNLENRVFQRLAVPQQLRIVLVAALTAL